MSIKMVRFLVLSAVVALTGVAAGCGKSESSGAAVKAGAQKYHCPMHPTYVSDRPGDCPICNMKLVPVKNNGQPAAASAVPDPVKDVKQGQFYCPMGAEFISDTPGICPKCGMKLIEKKPAAGEAAHGVAGRAKVFIAADKRQTIGLRLSPVEMRDLSFILRATARVEHDETRLARIAPRFSGWIRSVKVNFTGAPVAKGEPLFMVYSPDLFTAEKEYLLALKSYEKQKGITDAEQRLSSKHLLDSARRRLALWEISDGEIRDLEARGEPADELLFRAPFSGHVVAKSAVEGKAFMAGETLYEIADLSHLWLRASVFESEMPLLAAGQEAVVTFPYLGNQSFLSKITFIYPHIDPLTRRGEVRLELDNPGHLLRPEMWANVEIKIVAGKKLTVPASSVIDTGTRYVAFVDGADGHLEPRELKVGAKTDDYYEALDGVKEGEQVVTRALFLVDSESQLKAAISGMNDAGK
ncbi:MAG: efflux RND transporter periplasmic adaptor subunit [Victivallaceae bacterium]